MEKLPYLQALGINAIELLPIHEFNELEYYQVCHNPGPGLFLRGSPANWQSCMQPQDALISRRCHVIAIPPCTRSAAVRACNTGMGSGCLQS